MSDRMMVEARSAFEDDARAGAGSPIPWNDLPAFLAVARHGGLSAAARATGSSAPTLGRRMRAIERALGRDLFVRRTHGYDLTDAGRGLAVDLEEVEARVLRLTAPSSDEALPMVKVTAGTWTMYALAGAVRRIVGDPPRLRLRLLSQEVVLSIRRREASIGFRNARPTKDGLAGRRLRRVEFAPYAASDAPNLWIAVTADTPSARWVRARGGDRAACEIDSPRLALDLARGGVGRALLPTFVGDADPQLQRIGLTVEDLAHEQWLVTHADDRALPEVRYVLDRIVEIIGG